MRAALGILLLLTAAPGAAPQEKPQFVLGRVVDAATGAGVPGARVTLGPGSRPNVLFEFVETTSSAPVSGPRVITAQDGRFLIRDVAPGSYAIGVEATGFVPASFGQSRPAGPGLMLDVTAGAPRTDVLVRIWRYASLSGTVVDEKGAPAVGVAVRCFAESISGGQRRLRSDSSIMYTDDRGEYRVWNLEPGQYVCGAPARYTTRPVVPAPASSTDVRRLQDSGSPAQSADGTGLRVGNHLLSSALMARGFAPPAPDRNGGLLIHPTRFFPGVPTTTHATRITLSSGEHRGGIDFTMDLVPSTSVSGIVEGPDGPIANLFLTLVPASGSDFVSEGLAIFADTITAAGGRFSFLGVPPGDYLLKSRLYPRPIASGSTATQVEALDPASLDLGLAAGRAPVPAGRPLPPPPPDDPTLWTATPISVGDSPIDNIVVALRTGVRVTGSVVFDGATQPTADQMQRMGIRLQSAEGRTSSPIPADGRAAADGTFRTAGLPAGRYIISVLATTVPQGWRLKSATYLGKDVSVEPFDIADREITGAVLTFTDKTTQLSGTVQGVEAAGADLIVFPADSTAWRTVGLAARRSRYERIGKDGTFAISDLPPGEYFVAARPGDSPGDWRDPAVLERLTRVASRVVLGDGEQKRVSVKVVRP
jgi:hypothetical protein